MRSQLAFLFITVPSAVMGFSTLFSSPQRCHLGMVSSSSKASTTSQSDSSINNHFESTDCDDLNTPPSLNILFRSLEKLPSGSDIRGTFVDHKRVGSIADVAYAIGQAGALTGLPPLTPLAAHCLGHAFATRLKYQEGLKQVDGKPLVIAIGRDPRPHGMRLCDAFARGAQSVNGVRVVYTGLATTPAMFEFCRANLCDAAVMVTASHLPVDKNGLKFFTKKGGLTKPDIKYLAQLSQDHAKTWHDKGILPPSSGNDAVFCSEWVDFMPHYASTLRNAIIREVTRDLPESVKSSVQTRPLAGLRIVLNAGNGSAGFFQQILHDLGADVSCSIHVEPDGTFPAGVPNPEYSAMVEETTRTCEKCNADLGIMLDTDADRCGFIVPRTVAADGSCSNYEALNRNRLIALLATIFSTSSPGCTVVTCSVTSEGLSEFLQEDLGLQHVRYLKGYANVIGKAEELTSSGAANAELAIETSGHCAMKENGYLDDGTYTAVKIISLLARSRLMNADDGSHASLLDLIADMEEMPEEAELRMKVLDGTLDSTKTVFDCASLVIEQMCESSDDQAVAQWSLDTENLEGIRVRTGDGGFFMLRKSLHDPLISLQVEGMSKDEVRSKVIQPLLNGFNAVSQVSSGMDLSVLDSY